MGRLIFDYYIFFLFKIFKDLLAQNYCSPVYEKNSFFEE